MLTFPILADSIYTERYMHTPEHNPSGYDNATINDAEALGQNVRFMIMHGVSDDNVHLQNTLVVLDKLDLANVDNYDMQVFPDSDHSIFFHNGHTLVYERKSSSLKPLQSWRVCVNVDTRSLELARQCVQWGVASYCESEAR